MSYDLTAVNKNQGGMVLGGSTGSVPHLSEGKALDDSEILLDGKKANSSPRLGLVGSHILVLLLGCLVGVFVGKTVFESAGGSSASPPLTPSTTTPTPTTFADTGGYNCSKPILPNLATTEDLQAVGMPQMEADVMVTYRHSVGMMVDPMDILDNDVTLDEVLGGRPGGPEGFYDDADEEGGGDRRHHNLRHLEEAEADVKESPEMASVVGSVHGSADNTSTTISSLDGVDPSSETFVAFAGDTVAEDGAGGCTSDQMCLNSATVKELKSLKYIGKSGSNDLYDKRLESGYCFQSVEELLNENGELDGWTKQGDPDTSVELKSSTKRGYKKALNYLKENGEESKLCAKCDCAMCSESEVWEPAADDSTVGKCVSRCSEGFVWMPMLKKCVDASATPEVKPPPLEPTVPSAGVVKFDETPKEVRFSPTPKAARRGVWQGIQDRLAAATSSIDIAMFSFSDVTHRKAAMAAAERGVSIRIVMETGSCSQCKYCKELIDGTKGFANPIKVRFVTPTMHNKFTVIDYDSLDGPTPTKKCVVATGSCNWSMSSATRYDEDWIVFEGDLAPKTIRAYKQEFEWLWAYSRPCGNDPSDVSSTAVDAGWLNDRLDFDGCFTSYNMQPQKTRGKWGFKYLEKGKDVIGACNNKMIEAIDAATETIDIAHTYFRSEPIYEAVLRRHKAGIKVRVLNDGKEFRTSNKFPIKLAKAGADVRFKYYARGWDFSCAQQMHIKFLLIDADKAKEGGCILITGSENLSEGSEKNTFENVVLSRTPWVCEAYQGQFNRLLNYGPEMNENRTAAIKRYNDEATCFFSPITLNGDEIKKLRTSIDCRLRVGEYEGEYEEGECTYWGDRRPVLCFQNWYSEPCPSVSYVTVAEGDHPDLAIKSFSLPQTEFTISNLHDDKSPSFVGTSCTVINNGTVASQSAKMQFVASRTMDESDKTMTQQSSATIPELAPGETFTATPKFNFGTGHDVGPFFIICKADSDKVLLELSKVNNDEGIILNLNNKQMGLEAADLMFEDANFLNGHPLTAIAGDTPLEIHTGDEVTLEATIGNIGSHRTLDTTKIDSKTNEPVSITLNIYISPDQYWDSGPVKEGGDEQLGWARIDPLEPGGSFDVSKTVKINTPGTWYLIAVVDSKKDVQEQQEINNEYFHPTKITVKEVEDGEELPGSSSATGPAPDLIVSEFGFEGGTNSRVVKYGEQVILSPIIKNIGKRTMSNKTEDQGGFCKKVDGVDCTRLKYYFYSGPGADVITEGKSAEDVKVEYGMKYGTYEKINALAPNATQAHEYKKKFTKSSFPIGCWSVFALLDYDNLVEESNEDNNFLGYVDFEINDDEPDTSQLTDMTGSLTWTVPSRVTSSDSAWPSGTAPLGARITASLTVTLSPPIDGGLEALPDTFKVRFYLSGQSTSSRCVGAGALINEIFLAEQNVATSEFKSAFDADLSTSSDASVSLDVSLRLPANVEEKGYHILAKLDTDNAVEESKESNNIVATSITIENVLNTKNERAGMPDSMQVMENKNQENCPSIIKLDAKLYEKPSIGFWNLLHLSAKTNTERDRREWNIISCITAHFDILAVEELEDLKALEYLAKKACDVTTGTDCDCQKDGENPSTCEWDWHISHREIGRGSTCEYIGYVWNKRPGDPAKGAQFIEPMGFYNEGKNDTMKREPYGARFRLGNFDFTMAAIHQRHGGHPRYRQAEAQYSGDIFKQYQDLKCGEEKDVFYGGDMNLNAHDPNWSLMYNDKYTDLKVTYGVDPQQGTTLARTGDRTITTNSFDQVFYSTVSTTKDEVDEAGAFDFTSPEIMAIHGGTTAGNNIYTTVSDHIPVYVILNEKIFTEVDDDADSTTCAPFTPWPSDDSTDISALRNRQNCPVE